MRITSCREPRAAGKTALKFIADDKQTIAQEWLQLGTGVCQASSWLHLFSNLTRYTNSEPCGRKSFYGNLDYTYKRQLTQKGSCFYLK